MDDRVTGAVVLALVLLLALWVLLKGTRGTLSTRVAKELLDAIEGSAILLSDDSITIQKVVELTFMDASVRLTCVPDGKSATDLLMKEHFDMIIADVHMPASSGYEVCEYAKSLDPRTPVLLLVGAFEPFDETRYRNCGADEVLKKPFDSADLMTITGSLLKHREGDQRD